MKSKRTIKNKINQRTAARKHTRRRMRPIFRLKVKAIRLKAAAALAKILNSKEKVEE